MDDPLARHPRAVTRAVRAAVAVAAATVVGLIAVGGTAGAHDDIAGSVPADRSVIDEPISSVEIDFGEVIGDSVELFLTYDPGGDAEIVDIGGETTRTGDTTARLDFPALTDQGTYFVQYLAPVPADGHVLVGAISFSYGVTTAIDHGDDDVRSSTPSSRSTIDEPISSAEIEFDIEIADDPVLELVYDRGDGSTFDELGGVTTKTGPRTARVAFDELSRTGTYFVVYDAVNAVTGDEIVGAIGFVYGTPSTEGSSFPLLAFAALAVPILAIGAWFTYRRMLVATDDDGAVDDDGDGGTPSDRDELVTT